MKGEERYGYGLYGYGLRDEKARKTVREGITGEGEMKDEKSWLVYDSTLLGDGSFEDHSYEKSFQCLIPHQERGNQNLKEYIEKLLKEKRGSAIGIDFGGPGRQLFQGFERGFFDQTLGVTLRDGREKVQKEEDEENGHTIIGGNMFEAKTREEVKQWLEREGGGKKADVIFERLCHGLKYIAYDIRFLREVLKAAYAILAEGGVMFLEHHLGENSRQRKIFQEWSSCINEEYRGFLEIVWKTEWVKDMETGVFMLRKLEGAPEKLPGTGLLRNPAKENLESK
jgi:hypothetical protein